MQVPRSRYALPGSLALACLPALAGAQNVGAEFQINTYTTSYQRTAFPLGGHLVAADASGNFVVVWRSYLQDGSSYGVFGQRYDSAGGALGSEFRVNSVTSGNQLYPSVAAADDGEFVVVWGSNQDAGSFGIFGQRFDSEGVARGAEFRINTFTTGTQLFPSVASDAIGNFVVVWDSADQDGSGRGIFGQRYDSEGDTLGTEFRVNSYTTNNQRFPSVASDASGNFVVVWSSLGQDGDAYGVFGQRYDSEGAAQGAEFRVNSLTTSDQNAAALASDAIGNFVVVWNSSGQDGDSLGIFGRRYDNGGAALGDEFPVNSFTTGAQKWPSVASDPSGNLVVAWQSDIQDGSGSGVFGQRYDSGGVGQGDEFRINSFTTAGQQYPSVGAAGTDQFVVAWDSYAQDGGSYGVFGQRYDFGGLASLSIADVMVTEGNPPGRTSGVLALFTVTLSAASPLPVTVDFATANGTAIAPSDYRARSGTLSLSPGQVSSRIAVMIRVDNVHENDETFFVNLSNPTNATIADGQGVGTIVDDDP